MVEGLPPSSKSVLKALTHRKPFIYNALRCLNTAFSTSRCGKCFSPHFPQTENGRGFDSRCHIKRGDIATQVLQFHDYTPTQPSCHVFVVGVLGGEKVAFRQEVSLHPKTSTLHAMPQ